MSDTNVRTRVSMEVGLDGESGTFTEIPTVRRGGGGGRSSIVLDAVRAIPQNGYKDFHVSHPNGWERAVSNFNTRVTAAKLSWRSRCIRQSFDATTNSAVVRVYNLGSRTTPQE